MKASSSAGVYLSKNPQLTDAPYELQGTFSDTVANTLCGARDLDIRYR